MHFNLLLLCVHRVGGGCVHATSTHVKVRGQLLEAISCLLLKDPGIELGSAGVCSKSFNPLSLLTSPQVIFTYKVAVLNIFFAKIIGRFLESSTE